VPEPSARGSGSRPPAPTGPGAIQPEPGVNAAWWRPQVAASALVASPRKLKPKAGHELALKLPAWMQVDGVVDGFVGHGFFRIVGPKAPEFARNLLR
jgi:hypothetical protein